MKPGQIKKLKDEVERMSPAACGAPAEALPDKPPC